MHNISQWIQTHASFTPHKVAIIDGQQSYTYGELEQLVSQHARLLKHQMRIGRGDRVAYLGFNSIEFLCLVFACARLGALFIPMNWRLTTPEFDHILQDASPSVVLCSKDFSQQLEPLREQHPDCRFVAQNFSNDGWLNLPDMLRLATEGKPDDQNPHVDLNSPLLIVYTSGTTGLPKGAVLTQDALFHNALNSVHMHDMCSNDRILTVLPMFHVGGLNIQTLPALYQGATVILHDRFDPLRTLESIRDDQPSLVVLVPATLQAILDQPNWQDYLASLRSIATGSSVVPNVLIEPFHRIGLPVQQVYGLTETAPIAVYQRADQALLKTGSTGLPGLHCNMQLVNNQGDEVADGDIGHIRIKGPNVMFEYWGNPQATAKALHNGWFDTGDMGYRDADGHLVVADRAKDMIISGGENVYPAELENLLLSMPGIRDAAVVGRDDKKWGESPVAVVVLEAGNTLASDDILNYFHGRLARFKHPREVIFMEDLPRNVMGKVQKFRLRDMI
jgi:fatty-acyl-CoA synthase